MLEFPSSTKEWYFVIAFYLLRTIHSLIKLGDNYEIVQEHDVLAFTHITLNTSYFVCICKTFKVQQRRTFLYSDRLFIDLVWLVVFHTICFVGTWQGSLYLNRNQWFDYWFCFHRTCLLLHSFKYFL